MGMAKADSEVDGQGDKGGAGSEKASGFGVWLTVILVLLVLVLLFRVALFAGDLTTGVSTLWEPLSSHVHSEFTLAARYLVAFALGGQLISIAGSAWLVSVFFRRKRYIIAAILTTAAIDLFTLTALRLYDAGVLEIDLDHKAGGGVLLVAIIQYLGINRRARETFTR